MKIAINCLFLNRPNTGIGVMVRGYLEELKKTKHEIAPLGTEGWGGSFDKLKKEWEMGKQAEKLGCDVLWSPYPACTFAKIPHLMTIHDMITFADPRYQRLRTKVANHLALKAINQATHLHFVSQSSREDFEKFLPKNQTPKSVIYNAVKVAPAIKLSKNLQYPEPYLFYMGGYDVRKNVPKLIETWTKVTAETGVHLVLGGKVPTDNRVAGDTSELVKNVPKELRGRVHLTGLISEEEKYMLYRNALGMVHFSEAEGFNLVLLEAMSVGCPCLVSDIPVHREVGAKGAWYFDLANADEALLDFVQNEKMRTKLKGAGLARAKEFGWEKSAREMEKLLEATPPTPRNT